MPDVILPGSSRFQTAAEQPAKTNDRFTGNLPMAA
jgi:hypothetical protein